MTSQKALTLLSAIALTAATPLIGMSKRGAKDPGSLLIEKLANNRVEVTQTFSTPVGWVGHVVTPKGPGRQMIMYSTKAGDYLFFGNIVNSKGDNLSQKYTTQYINAALAKKASKTISSTTYFAEGKDSAPNKMYVFFDPNCSACNIMYKDIHPEIAKGAVQIRWIPVAFLRPSSTGIAAHLLSGKDDKARAKLLNQDETGFDMKHEAGGLKPLQKDGKNAKYFDAVKRNTDYFVKKGFYVTPTIIYVDTKGVSAYKMGAVPKGPRMNDFLKEVSPQWEPSKK